MLDSEFWESMSLFFFIISFVLSVFMISPKKIRYFSSLRYFIPIFFISIIALYVLPLSLFNYNHLEPSGNISPHLSSFSDYIPIALVLSSLFILIFSFSYRQLTFRFIKTPNFEQKTGIKKHELFIIYFLFILSLWMVYQLSKDAGLLNLILSGYGVTELFINKGHFAIGFDWIVTLSILLWGNALVTKNKKLIVINLLLLIVITLSFAVMGRRSVILIMTGSSIFMYHHFYKSLKLYKLIGLAILGFYLLNMIGFLRGGSYQDISSLIRTTQERKANITNDESVTFLYTITTGNFAVPFETFPQVIKSLGSEYNLGFGSYSLKSFGAIIPSYIWSGRPLPLSNWYMNTFYGRTKLNEGRQFFLLSAPYMDFGVSGIFLIGVVFAFFWRFILKIGTKYKNDVLAIAFFALVLSNTLNIVSGDLAGWISAFIKGYGFPIVFIYVIRKLISIN
jgi:oligosaccharide repeat unit polymerase